VRLFFDEMTEIGVEGMMLSPAIPMKKHLISDIFSVVLGLAGCSARFCRTANPPGNLTNRLYS
jgi:hypothetical protein